MQFYKVTGKIQGKNSDEIILRVMSDEWKQEVQEITADFTNARGNREPVFTSFARGPMMVLGAAAESLARAEEQVGKYLDFLGVGKKDVKLSFEEQVFDSFNKMISFAGRRGFLDDGTDILETLGLAGLERSGRFGLYFGENLLESRNRKMCEEEACRLIMDGTMLPELERIYTEPENKKAQGHPVHYMIRTDDLRTRRESCKNLLSALYDAGRIKNRRYVFMDLEPGERRFPTRLLSDIYDSAAGGAVILRFGPADETEEDEYADPARDLVESVAGIVDANRHKVLTILCFPRECTRIRGYFEEYLSRMSFVMLSEELVNGPRAKEYLKRLCKERGVRADKALLSKVEGEETYLTKEMQAMFDLWFDKKLKKDCYPQYREFAAEKERIAKEKPKGNAAGELEEMIGLTRAKQVMKEALDYFKAQKVFADKGMVSEKPSMHMVFTGNPGSAKTTVARLFARIMRDNGVLSKGQMVECGRADLCAKYVGQTAPLVKQKFKEACGGVLFIDEAYSLVDDRNGLYGDEAINTIVQEMENHRDDCVVIFAGYPDKMEEFLERNPGLRSRIAFHVPFEDYNREELLDIAGLISRKKGLNLTVGAQKKLGELFEEARKDSDFGNGRYVRNVLEQAKMAQASRLLRMDLDAVTKEDVATLTEEDIRIPETAAKEPARAIGFCG